MNEQEHRKQIQDRQLQEKADYLFAACMQFLIAKEERFLVTIRNLSQELLDAGYESSFEHRRRALRIRAMFANLTLQLAPPEELDKVPPRSIDLKDLPDAS